MVAAVAQNTSWNTKLRQSAPSKSVKSCQLGLPIRPKNTCSPIMMP